MDSMITLYEYDFPIPTWGVKVGQETWVVLFSNIDLALDYIRANMLDYEGLENPRKWDDSNLNYKGEEDE